MSVGSPAGSRAAAISPPASVRDVEVPSADPVVRAASEVIGGPLGRYARVGGGPTWPIAATALTALSTLTLMGGMFSKGYCVANGWAIPETFWRGCYSDLPFVFAGTPLAQGGFPYAGTGQAVTQPPLTGALMWLTALAVPGGDMPGRQRTYFLIWAALITLAVAVLVRIVARSIPRNPWRAAHVAASPLLVTAAFVSPDLVGVALATYGLFLWSRGRPQWAGVLFGLAIAARTYPILLVLVVGILAARAGRLPQWAAMAGTALLTYAGTLLALFGLGVATGAYRGVGDLGLLLTPYRQWAAAGPDYGSLWYLPRALGMTVSPGVAVWLAVFGWGVALLVGTLVALSVPQRPTIAEVGLIVVGIVLLTGRALPVQSALWLLPLVALAGLRWRDHLIWATGEVLYFVAIWLYLGGQSDPGRALPLPWLMVFSMLRLAAIGWIVVAAWRRAAGRVPVAPEQAPTSYDGEGAAPYDGPASPATYDGEPDDLAGPLAGREDQLTIAFR